MDESQPAKATGIFSTCYAIQNLWLAAYSEGIGVGWVSILNNRKLKEIFQIPKHIKPTAYLCLGYISEFPARPMLEENGWAKPLDIHDQIHWDVWQ